MDPIIIVIFPLTIYNHFCAYWHAPCDHWDGVWNIAVCMVCSVWVSCIVVILSSGDASQVKVGRNQNVGSRSVSIYIFSKDQSVSMYDYYGLIAKQWTQTWWEKKYIGPWTYNWKYRFWFWTFCLPIHLGVKKITIKEIKEWHWHLTCICKYYKSALKWEHTSGTCLRSFKGKYLVITAWFLQALAQYIRICI